MRICLQDASGQQLTVDSAEVGTFHGSILEPLLGKGSIDGPTAFMMAERLDEMSQNRDNSAPGRIDYDKVAELSAFFRKSGGIKKCPEEANDDEYEQYR